MGKILDLGKEMISVVIPMYNSASTIIECIDSVLKQTRVDLIKEIIVVNDGSTDNCSNVVETTYANNELVTVINQENRGVSAARNAGIRMSTQEWIAFLDSDDVWLPKKIEKQWDEILKNPNISFIGCGRNNENVCFGKKINNSLYCLGLKDILMKTWPHTSTALLKRVVLNEIGLFNESRHYAEDGELWNRIAIKYPLYYLIDSYEIAGAYKNQFGESGLSANLVQMHLGNIQNIKDLVKNKHISRFDFWLLRIFYQVKFWRRKMITFLLKRRR